MQENVNIRLWIDPQLDKQWLGHVNVLLSSDDRVVLSSRKDSDYKVISCFDLRFIGTEKMQINPEEKFILLSLGDIYHNKFGLRAIDNALRDYLKDIGCRFVYLECEVEPQEQKLYSSRAVTILTMPMGYIAGSKMNVHYRDDDDSAWHLYNLFHNPKNYEYDWCWIGTDSSDDRLKALSILENVNGSKYMVRQLPSEETDREKHMKNIHADNKAVPYDKFMEIHRKSKIAISCNGVGMWCYKDAEMLARNCFVLRQYHPNLTLNPLSPIDGKHWVVFKNDELEEKLDYYIHNDAERERINDAGHEYFKEGLLGGWAKTYVDRLIEYKYTDNPDVFGDLRYESTRNL